MHQVFDNVLVLEEDDALVPTNVNRCRPAPEERNVPRNPNPTTGPEEPRTVAPERDTTDNTTRNALHDDTQQHARGSDDTSPFVIRIVDHTCHADGRITYRVQLSDLTIPSNVDVNTLPYRLVVQYWHQVTNPKRNPNLRKRGRPRKNKGGTNTER